jgi:hypothetical protein
MYISGYINLGLTAQDWIKMTRLICYWLMGVTTLLTAISGISFIIKNWGLISKEE